MDDEVQATVGSDPLSSWWITEYHPFLKVRRHGVPLLRFVMDCFVLSRPLQQIRLVMILSSTVGGGTTADRAAVRQGPRFSEALVFLLSVLDSHPFKQVRITVA